MEDRILKFYNKYGFPSSQVLQKILNSKGYNYTIKDISNIIQNQNVYQLHKKTNPNKIFGHIVAFFENQV